MSNTAKDRMKSLRSLSILSTLVTKRLFAQYCILLLDYSKVSLLLHTWPTGTCTTTHWDFVIWSFSTYQSERALLADLQKDRKWFFVLHDPRHTRLEGSFHHWEGGKRQLLERVISNHMRQTWRSSDLSTNRRGWRTCLLFRWFPELVKETRAGLTLTEGEASRKLGKAERRWTT